MPIPDYQTCMLPLPRFLGDGVEHSLRDAEDALAEQFNLSPLERAELLPSGQQGVFKNRIGWARTCLKKACLIELPKQAVSKITERGKHVLATNPGRIDVKYLQQWPEFIEFLNISKQNSKATQSEELTSVNTTPEEAIELASQGLREQLVQTLLSRILGCSPTFFEQLVVELLVKMGYGGSRRDAGERIGQTGDGGIDGIIKEDRLGLDTIFIQAKR